MILAGFSAMSIPDAWWALSPENLVTWYLIAFSLGLMILATDGR